MEFNAKKAVKKSTVIKALDQIKTQVVELESIIRDFEILDDRQLQDMPGIHHQPSHCGAGSKD